MIYEEVLTLSNLDRFLHATTPVSSSSFLPKSKMKTLNQLWHPWEREKVEYFVLSDLWKAYDEWSAYGAGVPISLQNGETLIQYYVPYLSAIQIYTTASCLRGLREEADSGDATLSDMFSDDSDGDKTCRWDASSSDENALEYDHLYPLNNKLGLLYLQHFECSTPYGRVPLLDKVNSMAQSYPGLLSLRSVDLSPASWMAVAWYPIYHIPVGRTIKELSSCFLTYHTLSSSFQDMEADDDLENPVKKRRQGEGIPLSPFGLATYKMQGKLWESGNNGLDEGRLSSLLSVADSWLKQLRVHHPDFDYFIGVRRG